MIYLTNYSLKVPVFRVLRHASRVTCYVLLFVVPLLLISCGRKGLPTLKAFEKPEKPAGVTAVHREDRIILVWSYPGNLRSSIKGFQILRSEGKGFEREAFVKSDQGSFSDESFKLGVTYEYKVAAQNMRDILGADSDIVKVTAAPLPPPPEDVSFEIKPDGVELAWKSSGADVCYNVYRSMEKGKFSDVPLNREPDCATSFKDNLLSPEKSVYYTVRPLHNTPAKDEGHPSQEIDVDPSHFVPSPPSDVRVVKTEDKTYLVWKESPEPWVRGYRVYRKIEGEEGFIFLGEAVTPAFADTAKIGKKAWYMIKAIGPSAASGPLTVEVP